MRSGGVLAFVRGDLRQRIKLVVSDLNGTWVADCAQVHESVCAVFRDFSVREPSLEEYRLRCGISRNPTAFYRQLGIPFFVSSEEIVERFRTHIRMRPPAPPSEGARELFEALRYFGHPAALVTLLNIDALERDRRRFDLGHYFPAGIYGGLREKATTLMDLRRRFRCDPGELLFVSDTYRDLVQANAVDCFTIGVGNGHGLPKTLKDARPKLVVASLRELQETLEMK